MLAVSIILFILAVVFAFIGNHKLLEAKSYEKILEQRRVLLDKRQEEAREAMRRNGRTSLELDKRDFAFRTECKDIHVFYDETAEDLDKYPSEAKRLAIVKSRLAHNLGYKILAEFPNPDESELAPLEDGRQRKMYEYNFQVREAK